VSPKRVSGFILATVLLGCVAAAQGAAGQDFKLALTDHNGQLSWSADGFRVVQSSAKPNGREIGIRGVDSSGQIAILGFLFLVPEEHALTSAKCRDDALAQEKQEVPSLSISARTTIDRPAGPPVSLATYSTKRRDGSTEYVVRGFVAADDICGDLELCSSAPIRETDAGPASIFASYRFDSTYVPKFSDVVLYAQILCDAKMFQAAAPVFEKALTMLPGDGAPFPSAKTAKFVLTDQAGMAYGISGDIAKARAIFTAGIAANPEYPMYYYNLACADAEENKLSDARLHLQQAFARKANIIPGETMPDPTRDDSFTPYKENREFWSFLEKLQAGK
jgi:tetratricopeptide (TPR) repeat protein